MLYLLYCDAFFLFKQKTAYEMRISDWSSDVCSSDLAKAEVRMARPVIAWVPASAGDRLASCFKGLNADQAWPKLVEGTGVTKGQAQPFGTSFTSLPSLPSVSSNTEPSSLTSNSRIRMPKSQRSALCSASPSTALRTQERRDG